MAKYRKEDNSMFTQLKKLFNNKDKDVVSAITIYTDSQEDVFVDIKMFSDKNQDANVAIDHLVSIMLMFDLSSVKKVLAVLQQQCETNEVPELYEEILERVLAKSQQRLKQVEDLEQDKPCISPSEMM